MKKIIRITTVPISFDKLLPGQLQYMSQYFEVIAISSDKKYLKEFGLKNNIKTHYLPLTRKITPIQDFYCLLKLSLILLREKPEIVHTHTPKAGLIGMVASFFSFVPIRIHTVAGLAWINKKGLLRFFLRKIEKITYYFSTSLYSNSSNLMEFILKNKLCNKTKISVIGNGSSNGIDLKFFSNNIEFDSIGLAKKLRIKNDDFVFLFAGRVVKDKGINELLMAFNELKNQNIKLIILGNQEPELDPINSESLNILKKNQNILQVGFQHDVRPYFLISDVLVLPSHREGFPNVLLQAGAFKLPSIVTDINGCNEIIKNEINGRIIPVNSPLELKKALEYFYKMDEKKIMKFKQNAFENVTKKFSQNELWSHIKSNYDYFLNNLNT